MMVLILERCPASLRGELTRWMLEARSGVFLGDLSAMVRDRLWEKACENAKGGAVLMVYRGETEQGFVVRSHGAPDRELVDLDGLQLFRRPHREGSHAAARAGRLIGRRSTQSGGESDRSQSDLETSQSAVGDTSDEC